MASSGFAADMVGFDIGDIGDIGSVEDMLLDVRPCIYCTAHRTSG